MRARSAAKKAADWPRYMTAKRLRGRGMAGTIAYYWEPRARDRQAGFTLPGEALGTDYAAARDRAVMLNAFLDDWRRGEAKPSGIDEGARVGTVDWWLETFRRSSAFLKLQPRTQDDYRETMNRLADVETKLKDGATGAPVRFGTLPVSSITPAAADKVYERLRRGGAVTRQANYAVDVARRAWKVVARAHPATFLIPSPEDPKVRVALNPWIGIERTYGDGTTQPCTRAEAYALADALTAKGHPGLGIVAVIAFELLQRPENVIAGHLAWGHYRPADRPREIEIFHHKTGARLWHPLEAGTGETDSAGRETMRPLYPELEARLAAIPHLGTMVAMFRPQRGPRTADGTRPARLYSESYADHLVQRARDAAGLPPHVTLAACRHGGMTELGDAALPETLIMALSGHVTPAAARVYVKRTETQRLAAATMRRDWLEASRRRSGGRQA